MAATRWHWRVVLLERSTSTWQVAAARSPESPSLAGLLLTRRGVMEHPVKGLQDYHDDGWQAACPTGRLGPLPPCLLIRITQVPR